MSARTYLFQSTIGLYIAKAMRREYRSSRLKAHDFTPRIDRPKRRKVGKAAICLKRLLINKS